ncbi:permease-like cell division protein FtsX [Aquihabitans sp. G128]|uniref:permease-like cell division protein FtsX n=1 Tax=Aquihabitans sp. G128 TaxID=2849779 RepID=UPI001C2246D0|nr:permease-like cell division protein FtsX [Aquihabitans sp. G128]QXC62898.1 permease-like cell division protein FtsX [Aquihabitans sp. G128]
MTVPGRSSARSEASTGGALDARARRGTARGADAVLAAVRAGAATPLRVGDAAGAPWARTRRAVAASAVLALVLGAAVLTLGDQDRELALALPPRLPYCAGLAARAVPARGIDPDLSVYVTPAATPGEVSDVGAALRSDIRVDDVHLVDRTAGLARLRQQFAGQDAILAGLRREAVPVSYEVRLADGFDLGEAVGSFYAVPHVFDAVPERVARARVLDLLIASGHPFLQPGGPIAGTDAPFARRWPDLVAAVRTRAPARAAAAVDRLAAELRRRQRSAPGTVPTPSARLAAAAGALAASAERTCGLEPAEWAVSGEHDLDRVLSDAQLLPPGPGG